MLRCFAVYLLFFIALKLNFAFLISFVLSSELITLNFYYSSIFRESFQFLSFVYFYNFKYTFLFPFSCLIPFHFPSSCNKFLFHLLQLTHTLVSLCHPLSTSASFHFFFLANSFPCLTCTAFVSSSSVLSHQIPLSNHFNLHIFFFNVFSIFSFLPTNFLILTFYEYRRAVLYLFFPSTLYIKFFQFYMFSNLFLFPVRSLRSSFIYFSYSFSLFLHSPSHKIKFRFLHLIFSLNIFYCFFFHLYSFYSSQTFLFILLLLLFIFTSNFSLFILFNLHIFFLALFSVFPSLLSLSPFELIKLLFTYIVHIVSLPSFSTLFTSSFIHFIH